MARLRNTHLGVVSGRIGDIIFKNRKGTQYIAASAIEYKKPNTKAAKASRNVFGLTSLFYSALGKNYIIKNIWDNFNISKGNYVNKLKLFNTGRILEDFDLSNVTFVPTDDLFSIEIISASLENLSVVVTVRKSPEKKFYVPNSKCSMQGVLHCCREAETLKESNRFIPVSSDDLYNLNDAELTFTLSVREIPYGELKDFNSVKLYVNLIIKDDTGTPYKYSSVVKADIV